MKMNGVNGKLIHHGLLACMSSSKVSGPILWVLPRTDVSALRDVLENLMGITTPCSSSHFMHNFSREALDVHEIQCPTVTHALVPQLYAALDPGFLPLQIRRGVFGLSLFDTMGDAMRAHCAPVRDEMVDDMVRTARKGDVTVALRKCFDCVEIMTLVSSPAIMPQQFTDRSVIRMYVIIGFEISFHICGIRQLRLNTMLSMPFCPNLRSISTNLILENGCVVLH